MFAAIPTLAGSATALPREEARTERLGTTLAGATIALLVGAALIYGVGLAHPEALHQTAHDTRHAMGFPCH